MTSYIRPSLFESDDALRQAIEDCFGTVEPDSKRAYEEIIQVPGFGYITETLPIVRASDLQQGYILRVVNYKFGLITDNEDDLPLMRAILYGAIRGMIDPILYGPFKKGMVNPYSKDQLHMWWRLRPISETNRDFGSAVTEYLVWFRLGAWVDFGPEKQGLALRPGSPTGTTPAPSVGV